MNPLLTAAVHAALREALAAGRSSCECSLDLDRTRATVAVDPEGWTWSGQRYPWADDLHERSIHYWDGAAFARVERRSGSLIKLVPTPWGAPTFEIDGIKMLPTAKVSPYEDAAAKVELVRVRGRAVLDTCGGLGYFAACCLERDAASILSCEKSLDVMWLRSHNSWSPRLTPADSVPAIDASGRLTLINTDISRHITTLPDAAFDAVLHDPPRFGIAGELYSQAFYDQLARVLRRGGRLFHYTGTPNKLTTGRNLPAEVTKRLQRAGFSAKPALDGVLAVRS